MASGCARGGADCGIGSAGGCPVEDGNVRNAAIQPWTLSGSVASERALDRCIGLDWDCLWRASSDGPAQHEEGDCLFVSESPGLRGTWDFQFHASRVER